MGVPVEMTLKTSKKRRNLTLEMEMTWLFTQNSTCPSSSCQHAQVALENDETPALRCLSCGKAWTFVPTGETPRYCPDDDPRYPGMLDNRGWSRSSRVAIVGARAPMPATTADDVVSMFRNLSREDQRSARWDIDSVADDGGP